MVLHWYVSACSCAHACTHAFSHARKRTHTHARARAKGDERVEIAVQEGGWRRVAAGHGYESGGESATGADPAMTWPGGVGPSEEATHVGKGAKHPAQPSAIARDSAVPLVTPTMTEEEQTKGGLGVQTQRERVAILREAVAAKAELRGQALGEASLARGYTYVETLEVLAKGNDAVRRHRGV